MEKDTGILKFIFCFIIMVAFLPGMNAQCDDKLIDKIIEKSGTDALFIREFALKPPIKDKRKKEKGPAPSAKYDVRLNKGVVYRFIVEDEEHSPAKSILQLRKENMVLASTYDPETRTNDGNFDFLCEESGSYRVFLSFLDQNTGCAAGAMFAIVNDSVSLASIIDSAEIQHVLYTGTENFIDIAASDIPGGSLEVEISRGKIEKEGGLYKITVDEPGKLQINVTAKDKNGKITETFKSEFVVMTPILPALSFAKSTGGIIKKADILNTTNSLEIHNYRNNLQYKIRKFEITSSLSLPGISNFSDNKLNARQLNLIRELRPGETFYIANIEIEDSNGKTYRAEPLGFIISE
jgi:hypothetical protein